MKGRINLASAARKASAKGRLSRVRTGARSGKRGGRGEREERAQHATEPKETQQARRHRTTQ